MHLCIQRAEVELLVLLLLGLLLLVHHLDLLLKPVPLPPLLLLQLLLHFLQVQLALGGPHVLLVKQLPLVLPLVHVLLVPLLNSFLELLLVLLLPVLQLLLLLGLRLGHVLVVVLHPLVEVLGVVDVPLLLLLLTLQLPLLVGLEQIDHLLALQLRPLDRGMLVPLGLAERVVHLLPLYLHLTLPLHLVLLHLPVVILNQPQSLLDLRPLVPQPLLPRILNHLQVLAGHLHLQVQILPPFGGVVQVAGQLALDGLAHVLLQLQTPFVGLDVLLAVVLRLQGLRVLQLAEAFELAVPFVLLLGEEGLVVQDCSPFINNALG